MQLDKLNTSAANIDPNIIACIGLMDDQEKAEVKQLMFDLLPTLVGIEAEMDEKSPTSEILECALAYATAAVTVAAVAGL